MAAINGEPKEDYLMSRGGLASARLTTQHFIITERQGWMLHPEIEKSMSNKKDLKIADIATGNGIWALNVAKDYPDAEIFGLDISSEQFPPSFTHPKNVTFDYVNIFDPIPSKYQNAFDVIHIRLIVAAIYNKDKHVLVTNILSMLKPGGYLQWDEVGGSAVLTVTPDMAVSTRRPSFIDRVDKVSGAMAACTWVDNLPQALEGEGFTEVLKHETPLNPTFLQHESECLMWSIQELVSRVAEMPKEGAQEEMAIASKEIREDIDSGAVWAYDWRIVVGRRPIVV